MLWLKKLNLRLVAAIIAIVMAVLSIAVIAPAMTKIENYEKTIEVLDDKKMNATMLSSLVTIASTAISAMPDDTASPLADELSDFSTPLLLVVCVLHLEKFLLTTFAWIAFVLLIPASCILFAINLYKSNPVCKVWATKLMCIGLLTACIIPFSVQVTNNIEKTHAHSVSQTFEQLENVFATFEHTSTEEESSMFARIVKGITEGVAGIVNAAKELLTLMIDAIAVMIITSCIIPALTLILFIWGIKSILMGKFDSLKYVAVSMYKAIPKRKEKEERPATVE